MKVVLASLLLSAASAASPDRLSRLVSASSKVQRRANQEEDEYNQAQEEEYAFLQNYEQVFMKCIPGEKSKNREGEWEYNSVVYRLCPTGSACDDKGKVCSEGYGDYKVGLQTYMTNFMEQFQQRNNNNNNGDDGNDFNFAEFGECRELDYNANDDGQGGQNAQYYVGPGCTEDGDIYLTLFQDMYCRAGAEVTDVSFEQLTGFQLPFSSGLMDDDECKPYYCYGQNENGEYEINDFCMDIYENSGVKCEEGMEYTSYYGADTSGCEYISALMPQPKSNGGVWFVFALLIAIVAGLGIWYFLSQKKKKSQAVNSDGLMM